MRPFTRFATIILSPLLATSLMAATKPSVTSKPFGKTKDGAAVTLYTLDNGRNLKAEVLDYGGTVVRLYAPDKSGQAADVVLGYNTIGQYEKESPYFGCVVGRYGNRIAKGEFKLDGQTYTLAKNNGPNSLHGGNLGFDKHVWKAEPLVEETRAGLRLTHTSPDGDEGYPGTLQMTMTYWLTERNGLRIEYRATTDKPTPVNLTHHGYFNLKGEGQGDILDHVLTLSSDRFTAVDATLIPTGELRSVKDTPLDFTRPTAIGARIEAEDEQLKLGKGYDHNFVLYDSKGKLALAATVREPKSGRVMEVWTTEPGIQLYTGNFLDGKVGKSGKPYQFRNGFCLETQHYPDSPNQPAFPSTILRPGETYETVTEYRFSAK